MTSKKAIVERLEQIKTRAAELALDAKGVESKAIANLAEEAAGLGLQLAERGGK